MMDIPNFHDGFFDGLWINSDEVVELFLRTSDQKAFTLFLRGVRTLRISQVMLGNIILDIVVRSAQELTLADMQELYGLSDDSPQASTLLTSAREQGFQLLELNPSYGADGLVLFKKLEINESVPF